MNQPLGFYSYSVRLLPCVSKFAGWVMDQFVLVSHAAKDKPLLKELVAALIGAGIKIWVDKPSKLGFSVRDIERHFYRIRAGGRWEDEIDEAKRKAACILVCWSKRAEGQEALKDYPVWFEEAAFGRTEGKLVSCRIEAMNVALIPRDFSQQQIADVTSPTGRELAITDIKRVMKRSSQNAALERQAVGKQRSPLLPYLINRTQQESAVEDGLEANKSTGGVRPFFLAGPENECVDEFLKRLEEHSSRRCLGGMAGWEAVSVSWPSEEPAGNFAEFFTRRTAGALGHRGKATTKQLAYLLSARVRPVAVISRLTSEDWKQDEEKRVRAWLRLWRGIATQPGFRNVVPILAVKMPRAAPGWKEVPSPWFPSAEGRRNRRIWDDIGKLAGLRLGLEFVRLEILRPLPKRDAHDWCSEYVSLTDRYWREVQIIIDELFSSRVNRKHGVPHADFVDGMQPLFGGASSGGI